LCARLALSGGRRTGTHTARPGPLRSTGVSGLRHCDTPCPSHVRFGRKFELGASVHRHDLAHPHGQMRTVAPPSRPPLARGLRTGRTRCYHRASTPTDPRVATMRPLTRQRCRSVCRSRPRATPPNFHPAPAPLDRARLPRSRHDTGAACRMFLQAPSHPPQALIQPSHHGRPRRSDRYRSYALRACHAIHTQQESRRPERASWRATLLPRHAHVSCSSEWLRHTSASASTGADGDGGDASQSHAATLFSFVSNSSSSNSSSGMVHGVKSSSAASPKL
jgi:hypothetical protein